MPHATELPPFPSGLRETSLVRLPLSSLLDSDPSTLDSLFETCQSDGFFYLDLTSCPLGRSLLDAADALQSISTQAFHLPQDVKRTAHQSVTDSIFGWKGAGAVATHDPYARSDRGEFWNISKDDALANPGRKNVPYPPLVADELPRFERFMRDAHGVGLTVLRALAVKLGVDPDAMTRRHRMEQVSGDHVRLTWGPGSPAPAAGGGPAKGDEGKEEKDVRITTFAHTDFGSVTLLFNWLGGLQIENGRTGEWEWVRPLPGHAICNLGDAMVTFSGGRLASGKHRVVSAPGEQSLLERYSVVYFVRPEDAVLMEDLTPTTAAAAAGAKTGGGGGQGGQGDGKVFTAGEWIRKKTLEMGNIKKE